MTSLPPGLTDSELISATRMLEKAGPEDFEPRQCGDFGLRWDEEYHALDLIDRTIERHPWVVIAVPPGCEIHVGARFSEEDLYYGIWTRGITFQSERNHEIKRY